jgi:hypothetical protein
MRYAATSYRHSLFSVIEIDSGRIVEYASSSVEAQKKADKWNEGGRPEIPPMPDCSFLDDMGHALLSRPTQKQEKVRGIQI